MATFTYTGPDQTFRAAGVTFDRNMATTVDDAHAIQELRGLPDFLEANPPPAPEAKPKAAKPKAGPKAK